MDYGGTRYADLSMSDVTRKGARVIVHVPPAPPPHSIEMENSQQLLEAVLNEYQDPQCICFLSPAACEGNLYRDPGGVSGFGSVTLLVHRARAPYLRIQVEVIELLDGLARAARARLRATYAGADLPGNRTLVVQRAQAATTIASHPDIPEGRPCMPVHCVVVREDFCAALTRRLPPGARLFLRVEEGLAAPYATVHHNISWTAPGLDHLVELTPPPPLPSPASLEVSMKPTLDRATGEERVVLDLNPDVSFWCAPPAVRRLFSASEMLQPVLRAPGAVLALPPPPAPRAVTFAEDLPPAWCFPLLVEAPRLRPVWITSSSTESEGFQLDGALPWLLSAVPSRARFVDDLTDLLRARCGAPVEITLRGDTLLFAWTDAEEERPRPEVLFHPADSRSGPSPPLLRLDPARGVAATAPLSLLVHPGACADGWTQAPTPQEAELIHHQNDNARRHGRLVVHAKLLDIMSQFFPKCISHVMRRRRTGGAAYTPGALHVTCASEEEEENDQSRASVRVPRVSRLQTAFMVLLMQLHPGGSGWQASSPPQGFPVIQMTRDMTWTVPWLGRRLQPEAYTRALVDLARHAACALKDDKAAEHAAATLVWAASLSRDSSLRIAHRFLDDLMHAPGVRAMQAALGIPATAPAQVTRRCPHPDGHLVLDLEFSLDAATAAAAAAAWRAAQQAPVSHEWCPVLHIPSRTEHRLGTAAGGGGNALLTLRAHLVEPDGLLPRAARRVRGMLKILEHRRKIADAILLETKEEPKEDDLTWTSTGENGCIAMRCAHFPQSSLRVTNLVAPAQLLSSPVLFLHLHPDALPPTEAWGLTADPPRLAGPVALELRLEDDQKPRRLAWHPPELAFTPAALQQLTATIREKWGHGTWSAAMEPVDKTRAGTAHAWALRADGGALPPGSRLQMTLPSGRVLSLHGDDTAAPPPAGEAAPAHALHDQLAARRAAAAAHGAARRLFRSQHGPAGEQGRALHPAARRAGARLPGEPRGGGGGAGGAPGERGQGRARLALHQAPRPARGAGHPRPRGGEDWRGRAGRPHGEPSRGRGRPAAPAGAAHHGRP